MSQALESLSTQGDPPTESDPLAESDPMGRVVVRVGLSLSLSFARTRDDVTTALWDLWDSVDQALAELAGPSGAASVDRSMRVRAALRESLASLLEDPSFSRGVRWSVVDEARVALAALDEGADQDAATLARAGDCAEVAAYVNAADFGSARLDRTFAVVWREVDPPRGRRAALLFDVAERVAPSTRGALLVFLARQGVDVRGVLAGDAVVSVADRVEALSQSSRWRAMAAIEWDPDALTSLARMLADWSRFASHPRVLLYGTSRRLGAIAFDGALAKIARWPLAREVAAELELHRHKTPARVIARALGGGRHRCGRCDDEGVRAVRRWSDDGDDGASASSAGEVEYQCVACGLRYWAAWDSDSIAREPEPEAWVVP